MRTGVSNQTDERIVPIGEVDPSGSESRGAEAAHRWLPSTEAVPFKEALPLANGQPGSSLDRLVSCGYLTPASSGVAMTPKGIEAAVAAVLSRNKNS